MKFFSVVLIIVFALIGAHVPKSFSLLYLALVISGLLSWCLAPRSLPPLPVKQRRLLHTVQVMVSLFSCTYPLAMLHFGFWQLTGRQILDVVSAVVLPSALLWWGAYWGRRDIRLFVACLLSYGFGGLVFLVSALLKTWDFNWFQPHADAGSLLMAWGSEASMNVRSIEQNGILNLVLLPVGLVLLLRKRYWPGGLVLIVAFVGWLSILPLAHGRLWIVSLALACWPLVCFAVLNLLSRFTAADWTRRLIAGVLLMTVAGFLIALWPHRSMFCDERFSMYMRALEHWPALGAGGRILEFQAPLCADNGTLTLVLRGGPPGSTTMLHSVPLDVMATIGFWPALPMLIFLGIAFYAFIQFSCLWLHFFFVNRSLSQAGIPLLVLWSFSAVIFPQWLFQPLIYGDGLLYYLSYAILGCTIVIKKSI